MCNNINATIRHILIRTNFIGEKMGLQPYLKEIRDNGNYSKESKELLKDDIIKEIIKQNLEIKNIIKTKKAGIIKELKESQGKPN